ncbi:hypothetical protein VTL71DRAFT_8540 [Oculimacula yallundae]|uniref:60S ribosomal protein L29 n=1 Tax=Oculimacula yallundae TaxID=86028 RepID=A0ABR4D054_9HELO
MPPSPQEGKFTTGTSTMVAIVTIYIYHRYQSPKSPPLPFWREGPRCAICNKGHLNFLQSKKAHRNGIKKPKTSRYPSLKGTDPKFRRNHRHALHGTMKALKELKEGKRETA